MLPCGKLGSIVNMCSVWTKHDLFGKYIMQVYGCRSLWIFCKTNYMFSLTEVEGVHVATEECDLHMIPAHSTFTTSWINDTIEEVRKGVAS